MMVPAREGASLGDVRTTDAAPIRSVFALLLPAERAARLAARWFEEVGVDDVTADGWYVCQLE